MARYIEIHDRDNLKTVLEGHRKQNLSSHLSLILYKKQDYFDERNEHGSFYLKKYYNKICKQCGIEPHIIRAILVGNDMSETTLKNDFTKPKKDDFGLQSKTFYRLIFHIITDFLYEDAIDAEEMYCGYEEDIFDKIAVYIDKQTLWKVCSIDKVKDIIRCVADSKMKNSFPFKDWEDSFLFHPEINIEHTNEKTVLIQNASVLNKLGYLYQKTNKIKEAQIYYEHAIKKGSVDALNNMGTLYQKANQDDKAEEFYLKAVEKGDSDAMYNLAVLYESTNRIEEAEKYYKLSADKGHVYSMNNLGILYEESNRKKEAEKYYKKAVKKEDEAAMNNLAMLYHQKNQLEKAKDYYEQSIDKEHLPAMQNLAILYEELDQNEKAKFYYKMAADKGYPVAMNNLALIYQNENKKEEAEKYFKLAIKNGDIDAIYNIAVLYETTHQKKKLEKILKKIAQLDKKFDEG